MAIPDLKKAEFPKKLHKKMRFTDPARIEGTGIQATNKVKVVGHHGTKATVWDGTIKANAGGDVWTVDDLTVRFVERGADDKRDAEDVSVTVTNGDGESQPLIVRDAPIIP